MGKRFEQGNTNAAEKKGNADLLKGP